MICTRIAGDLFEAFIKGSASNVSETSSLLLFNGQPFARNLSSEGMRYLHRDQIDSAVILTGSDGEVCLGQSFDSFGKIASREGQCSENTQGVGYGGHEFEPEYGYGDDALGFVNMGGRMYDPVIGRFLQPDIAVSAASSSQAYNPYSYVLNNPVSLTDPTGYRPEEPNTYPPSWAWEFGFGETIEVRGKRLPTAENPGPLSEPQIAQQGDTMQSPSSFRPTTGATTTNEARLSAATGGEWVHQEGTSAKEIMHETETYIVGKMKEAAVEAAGTTTGPIAKALLPDLASEAVGVVGEIAGALSSASVTLYDGVKALLAFDQVVSREDVEVHGLTAAIGGQQTITRILGTNLFISRDNMALYEYPTGLFNSPERTGTLQRVPGELQQLWMINPFLLRHKGKRLDIWLDETGEWKATPISEWPK